MRPAGGRSRAPSRTIRVRISIRPSDGSNAVDVNELRDPDLLEAEGRRWRYYSAAGESALGAAELLAP